MSPFWLKTRNRELVVPWSMAPTKLGRIMALELRELLLDLSLLDKEEIIQRCECAFGRSSCGGKGVGLCDER
jgi:hypothetical protein